MVGTKVSRTNLEDAVTLPLKKPASAAVADLLAIKTSLPPGDYRSQVGAIIGHLAAAIVRIEEMQIEVKELKESIG
jgi:hypothetical protein